MISRAECRDPEITILLFMAGVAMGCRAEKVHATPPPAEPAVHGSLTDVAGLEVGHHTRAERPTGCTVILAMRAAASVMEVASLRRSLVSTAPAPLLPLAAMTDLFCSTDACLTPPRSACSPRLRARRG